MSTEYIEITQDDELEPIWDTEARQVLPLYANDEQLANYRIGDNDNGNN